MKKFSLIFLSFIFLGASSLFATSLKWEKIEKAYIDPALILIKKEGIFVPINNDYVQVQGIEQDKNGFFVSKVLEDQELRWNWTCKYCNTNNSPFRIYCKGCGKRWTD